MFRLQNIERHALGRRAGGAMSHGTVGTESGADTQTYSSLPNKVVGAGNGIDYAYRDVGQSTVPLVLLQHFRGNLDNWDPALIDALASTRRVVTFDDAGVGGSTGTTPDTIEQMARDAIAFLAAMEFNQVDLLGFSIGSFIAQQIALTRPAIVRRLVLASSAPQGAAGMHGWAPEVNGASDPMILPRYSYLLAGLLPQARVKLYPDAAHGFLFQHHAEFAADVAAFLAAPDPI